MTDEVLIDSHETPETVRMAIKMLKGLTVRVVTLPECDVVYQDTNVCIERKLDDDFLSSMQDGRLHKQGLNMQPFPHRFIIIEGDFDLLRKKDKRYRQYSDEMIYGKIASLEMKYNIRVLGPIKTSRKFWIQVERLIFKSKDKTVIEYSKIYQPKLNVIDRKDKVLSAVCTLNGVSVKKAQLILDVYPEIHQLCHVTIDELVQIKGIGTKVAEKVKGVYHE
jgi:ERCC4-type nuclease